MTETKYASSRTERVTLPNEVYSVGYSKGSASPSRGVCAATLCLALIALVLAGCGGGASSAVKAGAIVIANSSGVASDATQLVTSATAKLSMMPAGDRLQAGVDWTVSCGGNPVTGSVTNGACGTLTPVHTSDGATTAYTAPAAVPLGTSVAVTATVTSDRSQSSSRSLTIVSLPIVVNFFGNPPPASIEVNQTIDIQTHVTNDVAPGGVFWSAACNASACGSFTTIANNDSHYTAPSSVPPGGTVTITATSLTDTTKSISAVITILPTPVPLPISVSLSPTTFYASLTGSSRNFRVTPVVSNDAAAAGVDWKLSCGATDCGRISLHSASGVAVSYTAPASVPPNSTVTLTATSSTDPTASATAVATIVAPAPIVITIPSSATLPPTLTAGAQATLSATVANDSANLGVNWSASCGSLASCGSFNLTPAKTASGGQIIFTAATTLPAGTVVTITAASAAPAATPSNPALTSSAIIAVTPTIAFLTAPPATPLLAATSTQISAVVTNDVAPGGINWSVQCGSTVPGACGYILPSHTASGATATYTAPPSPPVTLAPPAPAVTGPVTIVATSSAAPQVSVSAAPLTIAPVTTPTIAFVPTAPSQVQAGATVNLSAAVANDATNAGVDWRVCASGCGFFVTQAAAPAIPATATTPYIPAVPEVTATTVKGWANDLSLPYTAPVTAPASGFVVLQVAAHASPGVANSATLAITSSPNPPALYGVVQAGTQPVVGAAVALYAAGTTGYGSQATPVFAPGGASTAPTDASGHFTFPAGYVCPQPNSQMYLVATGGQVGTNSPNPNLTLMTALGSCNTLSSSPVVLNEVTSVASAYATAPFAANDALTGNLSYLYLGTSSTNVTGLVNAFAAVNDLVEISSGQVRFTVPAGNAVVPYVQINTLADILNGCANSSGGVFGDGSACDSLFTYTAILGQNTDPTSYLAFTPKDTLQAIFNIAERPVSAYGYRLSATLFPIGSVTDASPFHPAFTTTVSGNGVPLGIPNDWSLSLNYAGVGGLSSASVPGPIAIDATGNVWISGNGSLSELTSLGSPVPGSPFGGVAGGGSDMVFDAQSNLWITTGVGVAEFNSLGAAISPITGYVNDSITQVTTVVVDSSNNVWLGEGDVAGSIAELTNPGGQAIVGSTGQNIGAAGGAVVPGMAADPSGSIWVVIKESGGVSRFSPYGGKGVPLTPKQYSGGGGDQLPIVNPGGVALDGAKVVWVPSAGGVGLGYNSDGSVVVVAPNVLPINPDPSLITNATEALISQSLSAGVIRDAIDGSGNIWVLLADGSVTEYVGLATPVVTPVALGIKTKKLAAKP